MTRSQPLRRTGRQRTRYADAATIDNEILPEPPDFRYTTAIATGPLYYRDGRWRLVLRRTNGGVTWRGWLHNGDPFQDYTDLGTWEAWERGAVEVGEDEHGT